MKTRLQARSVQLTELVTSVRDETPSGLAGVN